MVFFCIPKAESSIKVLPKKKVKVEVKEDIMQNEYNTISQINSEDNLNNLNKLETEKNNEIDSDKHLNLNNINISKEIKTEINSIPLTVVIDNVQEIVGQCEQQQVPGIIQIESTSQALPNNDDFYKHSNSSNNNKYQEYLDTPNNCINKNEFTIDSDSSDINKEQLGNQNSDMNELLDENKTIKNEAIVNSFECYEIISKNDDGSEYKLINKWIVNENQIMLQTCKNIEDTPNSFIDKNELILNSDYSDIKNKKQFDIPTTSTKSSNDCRQTDINKSLLDENITIKSEAIVNFPECYEGIRKNDDNGSENQLINKWTIDEDKIILQTCKRVEDIEVLLETIKRRIPQRSVSEVRFFFKFILSITIIRSIFRYKKDLQLL